MGCQRAIARKIIDKKADYVLARTGNQSSLHDDVKLFAIEQKQAGFNDAVVSRAETVGGDHGRLKTRTLTVFHDIEWLRERHNWPSLTAVIMVESLREINRQITDAARSPAPPDRRRDAMGGRGGTD